ncbi:MAG TPA: winged helix-turn-helix domain-containing protein [Methanocella sp.]|uniref:winged helix-turn-helix domain-containing protein n=1 Tax=Methanocella sp. TaxID=2052833 RepID=UPI002C8B2D68|nr:winged helix-turn-helix domain-containing protein [Methanocella sp.]HTY90364.1 winged helix-turn-helix domain-containing protein [Methanocella sp.]
MKKKFDPADQELGEIKAKLTEVQNDLRRFIEQSNKQQLEFIQASSRKDLTNAFIGHMAKSVQDGLDNHMVRQCEMRDVCKDKFTGILLSNAGVLGHGDVLQETVLDNKSKLDQIKAGAPYKRCKVCLSEAYGLYEGQVSLMKDLNIYDTGIREAQDISVLPEDGVVSEFIEPISNETRLRILKSLYYRPGTFSSLSKLTGLRAGNLLFHLQKLQKAGLAIQRHEGGDYLITEKGYRLLNSLYDIWEKR